MGCDIHIVLERRKKIGGDWIGVYSTDELPLQNRLLIKQRDYDFFARIAAVRGSGPDTIYPKNLPEDISDLAWQEYMTAPKDHHSPSYMPAAQFAHAWIAVNPQVPDSKIRAEWAVSDLLGARDDEHFEYRVVFWFDN